MNNFSEGINKKLDPEKLILAGLLHDIGKFWQKTTEPKPFSDGEGKYFETYPHALWSSKFIERFIGDLNMADWVKEHHAENTSSIEAELIKLSDWLASGESRFFDERKSTPEEQIKLENIFDNLFTPNDSNFNKTWFPLRKASDYSNFFPTDDKKVDKASYDQLWNDFISDLKKLSVSNDYKIILPNATWMSILKKYTSWIPFATPAVSGEYTLDVSLFQHCKITSAIIFCLAYNINAGILSKSDIDAYLKILSDIETNNRNNPDEYKPIASFLGGDISGIQEYLYNIPVSGAGRQLKARSFIIQLLCDFVATYICEQFQIPPTNIIYSSGGRFYILMPVINSTDSNKEDILSKSNFNKLIAEITSKLLKYVKGEIHLITAVEDVKIHHFKFGGFNEVWGNITKEIARKKLNRYSHTFFMSQNNGYDNHKFDDSHNYYTEIFGLKDKKEFPLYKSTAGAYEKHDEFTEDEHDMEETGRKLRNAKYIIRRKAQKVYKEKNPAPLEFINSLGYDYEFYRDLKNVPNLHEVVEIIAINDFDCDSLAKFVDKRVKDIPIGYKIYANYWPTNNDTYDTPLTFEDFAKSAKGIERIAIFRADVDSLGNTFKAGLAHRNTLTRSAMLSNTISEFFEGYVNHLVSKEFRKHIGIIYSGGDDLFIVGAWDKVIDFAFKIQCDFKKYTNNRLSISGGVVVVDETTPLRLTAKMAEDAETYAKNYKRKAKSNLNAEKSYEKQKDCIVIFNTPIGYEEKSELFEIKNCLIKIYELHKENDKIPFKGILHKLKDIFGNYLIQKNLIEFRKASNKASTQHLAKEVALDRWKWLLVYSLRRYMKGDGSNEVKNNLERILDSLLSNNLTAKRSYKMEDKIGAILRWVELLTREKDNQ